MHFHQRSKLHGRLDVTNQTVTDSKVATKRCVRNFIRLFKKDCQPVLKETNESYQMKKMQVKGALNLNLKFNPNQSIDSTPQMAANKTLGFYKLTGPEGDSIDQFVERPDKNDPKVMMSDYSYKLKHNQTTYEGKYLEKIDSIIK